MKSFIILICLLACGYTTAHAETDYKCLNNCTRRGYLYQLCLEQCSFGEQQQNQQNNRIPYDNSWSNPNKMQLERQELENTRLRNELLRLELQKQKEERLKKDPLGLDSLE